MFQVRNTQLTESDFDCISRCQKLEIFEFDEEFCKVNPNSMAELIKHLPNLKKLTNNNNVSKTLHALFNDSKEFTLNLEEIDTENKLSPILLRHLVQHCPNLKKLRFSYLPSNREEIDEQKFEDRKYLSVLFELNKLMSLSLTDCDFYGHFVFLLLEQIGHQILELEFSGVGEINLNSLEYIGKNCVNMTQLSLSMCHYQICQEDNITLEANFEKLKALKLIFNNPNQIVIAKLVISKARNLESLFIKVIIEDFPESCIHNLFPLSEYPHLNHFVLSEGNRITIHLVNFLLEKCPKLERIGNVKNWRLVSNEELESMKTEIKARNMKLTLDEF